MCGPRLHVRLRAPAAAPQISGDPRRPAEVRKFTRDKQPPVDESASELYLMAALLFGMAALLLRVSAQHCRGGAAPDRDGLGCACAAALAKHDPPPPVAATGYGQPPLR